MTQESNSWVDFPDLGPQWVLADIVSNKLFALKSLTQDLLLGNLIEERNKLQEYMSHIVGGARTSPSVHSRVGWGVGQVNHGRCRGWTPVNGPGIRSNGLDVGLGTHLHLKNMVPSGKRNRSLQHYAIYIIEHTHNITYFAKTHTHAKVSINHREGREKGTSMGTKGTMNDMAQHRPMMKSAMEERVANTTLGFNPRKEK